MPPKSTSATFGAVSIAPPTSNSKVGVIRVMPPTRTSRATIAALLKPASAPATQADFDAVAIDIPDAETTEIFVVLTKGPPAGPPALEVPLYLAPAGWQGGGCPPTVAFMLGSRGDEVMDNHGLPYAATTIEGCRTGHCKFNGKGLLTIDVTGYTLTVDTTVLFTAGLYLTLGTDGTGKAAATIVFSTARIQPISL